MSDIKIFVTHTPNRDTMRVDNPFIYNVIAGSEYQKKEVPEGVYQDNQGENISFKNKSYCELTTQYWAWKNVQADYYGFCHYRRFFSFNKEKLKETSWGTVEYDFLNEQAMKELCFNENDMRQYIEQYDFLIAEGVSANSMQSKNMYNHYENAPELHIEDVELFLKIIADKYPYLSNVAQEFFEGKIFYPCNMFIMKRELFEEYSTILFDVLETFENKADMSKYSREGYRTTGHLGERMASIYYMYLKAQNKYRLGELQIALIHNADADTVVKASDDKSTVPVVLAANQKYVPILYTCAQSIVEHISPERNYEIYIFHTDITVDSQSMFYQFLERKNLKIIFVNVGKNVSGYVLKAKQHITTETFYRFLILDILKDYPKVVYLDCDLIVCHDVADLFDTDLEDNLIAATLDADFAGQCNMKHTDMRKYAKETLGLEDPFVYFQAGVLVLNTVEINKVITVQKLLEMSDTGIYRFSDQDILNVICKGRVVYLDMSWNMIFDCDHFRWNKVIKFAPFYILDDYENARKNPYIIHYAGFLKPWMKPDEDFGYVFWSMARKTPYYEQLLTGMQIGGGQPSGGMVIEARAFKRTRKLLMRVFKPGSKWRSALGKIYWKIFG